MFASRVRNLAPKSSMAFVKVSTCVSRSLNLTAMFQPLVTRTVIIAPPRAMTSRFNTSIGVIIPSFLVLCGPAAGAGRPRRCTGPLLLINQIKN